MCLRHRTVQLDYVENKNRDCDHHTLAGLQTVDAGHNIDRIRTEDHDHNHEHIVENAQINYEMPRFRKHNVGDVVIDQVDG